VVITSGGERFVIPQVSLLELIHLDEDSTRDRSSMCMERRISSRGRLLPVVSLNQVLKLNNRTISKAPTWWSFRRMIAVWLLVDGINDTQEIVVKRSENS